MPGNVAYGFPVVEVSSTAVANIAIKQRHVDKIIFLMGGKISSIIYRMQMYIFLINNKKNSDLLPCHA